MTRSLNRLSARQVSLTKKPGRHADGGGLYLRVSTQGAKSWAFLSTTDGVRAEIGIGSANAVTLATAREIAAVMREAVAVGRDPRAALASRGDKIVRIPTFAEFAEAHITSVEGGWKNPVHRRQWRQSLRDHASALNDLPVDQISTADILSVLQPIWLSKPETGRRVRSRIENILDAARALKLRPEGSFNPAIFRGHLKTLLPKQPKRDAHHNALPIDEAPRFVAQLRARTALAARCLEFTILTAARSGETLGATWGEIDLGKALWTVPAERMKAGKEHVVPLSTSAVALLSDLATPQAKRHELVFGLSGVARSNMAMAMLLRRMNYGHITVHGFRSTFRDWAGDRTKFPREIIEAALAHTIQSKAEAPYRRLTAVQRRRPLMQAWDNYLKRP